MKFNLKKEDKKQLDIINKDNLIEVNIAEENKLEEGFNPWNYVRVLNVRGDLEFHPKRDEKVIVAHRANPILGNKNIKEQHTIDERDRVIQLHKKDLEEDIKIDGPISKVLREIAKDVVENNQKYGLSCFCYPSPCHVSNYLPEIVKMINEELEFKKSKVKKNKI